MWQRLLQLTIATLALVGIWALSLIGDPNGSVWVHPLTGQPRPVRILRFYATAGTLFPGQTAQLCYSVENARIISISPPVETAYPSLGHCLQISPRHTTHYTLQAEGFDGRVAVRSITLPVQDRPHLPPPALQIASSEEWQARTPALPISPDTQ